jgi:hypothetical protein
VQCSVDLAKALGEAEKLVEALEAKAAAELKKRILRPPHPPPEPPACPALVGTAVPTVSRMEILTCEPGASQSLVLWNEERVFEVLARVVARRDTGAPTAGGGPAAQPTASASTVFDASTVAAQLSRLSAEAFVAATQALRACRHEVLEECRCGGLELLDEARLGFAGAAVRCNTAESSAAAWLAPGWLELLQAAAEAGAVRLVAVSGVWEVARGERVSESGWSPQVFDVSLKFTIDLQAGGRRVAENELVFQIKVRHDTPILHEEIQRPKRPPKGSDTARTNVKDKTFRLRAWGLRCGGSQIFLRLGVQHDVRAPESGDTRAVAGLSRAPLWGPWSSHVSITLPPDARAHLEASSAQLPAKRKAPAGSAAVASGATDATSSKKTAACGEAALSGFVWPTTNRAKWSAQPKAPAQDAAPATRGARGGVKAAKAARAKNKDVEAAGAEAGVTTGIDAIKALQASWGATTAPAVVGSACALAHQSPGALQAPAARQTSATTARSAQEGGVAGNADMQHARAHAHTHPLTGLRAAETRKLDSWQPVAVRLAHQKREKQHPTLLKCHGCLQNLPLAAFSKGQRKSKKAGSRQCLVCI